jgi:hypothetical protein
MLPICPNMYVCPSGLYNKSTIAIEIPLLQVQKSDRHEWQFQRKRRHLGYTWLPREVEVNHKKLVHPTPYLTFATCVQPCLS